jgi:predicted esterase
MTMDAPPAGAPRLIRVSTAVHGRVLVDGASAGDPRPLLVGFHGYGENAERHLQELRAIPGVERWAIASVQALHPFYNKTGEVIGSWMTKLDREQAIEDNVAYVRSAIERLRSEKIGAEPVVFAGFSQGAAMAWRAAARSVERCAGVVVLGGDVPPDLAERDLSGVGGALLGRGDRDDWYSAEKLAADLDLLRRKGLDAEAVVYDGGHEWTDAFRAAAGLFLARRP